jgi:hypothetical protein
MNEAKNQGLDNDANQLPANKAAQDFWNTIKHKKIISVEDIKLHQSLKQQDPALVRAQVQPLSPPPR